MTQILRGLILVYRYGLSFLLPGRCRYLPTCSEYGLEALQRHGPIQGGWLTLRRFLRCHPWGGHGHDPVPEMRPRHQSYPPFGRRGASHRSPHKIRKATPHV